MKLFVNSVLAILLEIFPSICFFISYKLYGVYQATIFIFFAALLQLIATYYKDKKISARQLFSSSIILFFGLLTLFTKNTDFIKIKITIINLFFSLTLLAGIYYKKPFLKTIFGPILNLSDENWFKLSMRFAFFFALIGVSNEIVWRNFSENSWVNYKIFYVKALNLLFFCSQMPFIYKNNLHDLNNLDKKDNS